ncbi:MAG: serine/threonine protein kinase [Planctomycetia bacterium]|nr:serine/threonine protein kinase [Planctomycetia bacterium]
MPIDSAEGLIQALRASGLFTPEQFRELLRELAPLRGDLRELMRHLVEGDRITVYQLRKVIHGKAAELFVGPYVITDKLGQGGMGKVFRARQTRIDREVALKVVHPTLITNATIRGRYEREVEAAGRLDHPNIVRVFDAGEANGRFYMAMEFVDGIDFARLIRDYQVLEVAEACEYVRQAALGLQHAHDCGYVHRDIKPSNVLVAGERHIPQATEPAVVKILDLGLTRAMDPDDMAMPDLTRDHTIVGTPDYMAPEQAKNSKLVDCRADLYSLGCTLYFLLAGHPPFPEGNKLEKLMYHQLNTPRPIQTLRPDVPASVAELIARLMEKKPEDRVQSAAELASILEPLARYAAGAEPVEIPAREARSVSMSAETLLPDRSAPPFSSSSASGSNPLMNNPTTKPPAGSVAPSDPTPRPIIQPIPLAPIAGEPGASIDPDAATKLAPVVRKTRRRPRPPKPQQEVSPLLWVALALGGIALLALTVWVVSKL